jgi:hypothetical protein
MSSLELESQRWWTGADGPFHYKAFGLSIQSQIELPELPSASGLQAQLSIIRLGDLPPVAIEGDEPALQVDPDQVVMNFAGVGRFVIRPQERSVGVYTVAGDEPLARLPLLGPVMATYLHVHQVLVLHGSAVRLGGGAVAFLGDKGAGKSTTAAVFARSGVPLITDDLLVCVKDANNQTQCEPTFAQLKLTDETAQAMPISAAEELPSPHPLFGKRQQRLEGGPIDSCAMRAICILERGSAFDISRHPRQTGLVAILRFAYMLRYGGTFLSGDAGTRHFQRCVELADNVNVYRLVLPSTLSALEGELTQFETRLAQLEATS